MNRFVVGFMALAVGFAVLFVMELQGYFSEIGEPAAIIQTASGSVRRLPRNALSWDRAQEESYLALGDTISTGESSSAKIRIFEGGEVTLGPGAMVVLGGDTEELKLNFVSGEAKVRVAKSAKNKIKIRSTPTLGKKTASRQIAMETVSDKELPTMAKPDKAVLRKPVLKTPKIIADAPKAGVEVAKLDPAAAGKIDAEIDKPIVRAIKAEEIRDLSKGLSTDGKVAKIIKQPPIPEIVFPPDEDDIELGVTYKNKEGRLRWRATVDDKTIEPTGYLVKLFPLDSKSKPRIFRTKGTSIPLAKIGSGHYKWSVRALTKGGARSRPSTERSFSLKIPIKMNKPVILPVQVQ